ncbi:hypothetical protein FR943_26030 [Mycobacterium sp. TNTM28]|uniref:Uncharacterized protein n=1 Tax=[Mycobacterium] fortunisiensis TaxID=2600579 RepID=A0ABS6KUM0_9MYCO|nr:hypothetical protein [[Mycobacterium] fortunisiensis]MBU9767278.1 hypothetical protein [[Mycobacterium] fortunisiensis]
MKSEKACGTVGYRMHVIARDAAELTANAGGLIVDRMMSGWRVSVQLLESDTAAGAARPVQILGAELVDGAVAAARPDEEKCVLVLGGEMYRDATTPEVQQILSGCAEVLVWGAVADQAHRFGHQLSAAARAFKARAGAAAGIAADTVTAAETFTSMNAQAGTTLRA